MSEAKSKPFPVPSVDVVTYNSFPALSVYPPLFVLFLELCHAQAWAFSSFPSAEKPKCTHANERTADVLSGSHYVPGFIAASWTMTNCSCPFLLHWMKLKIHWEANWDMIRWGCFSSSRISESDKTVNYIKNWLSHRDAWLEFVTISFGQNFFHEIVGTLWSASALFLLSANP